MIKIGMRNIKTAISVFICLLVFELINRDNPIFACIAAVICVQNTIIDSKETGISRIIGTIIGGLAGAFTLFIVNTFFNHKILIFIIPLGIMLLIKICVTINMKKAVVICCVVFLVITMNYDEGYILYTFNRVLDTSIGIIIALLVNKYVKIPEKLKTKIRDKEELIETHEQSEN